MTTDTHNDTVDRIMRYESGELSDTETVEMFADLVTSGTAWQLQGHYGRAAAELIRVGLLYVDPDTGVATPNYDRLED